jgi:hypothetical protein
LRVATLVLVAQAIVLGQAATATLEGIVMKSGSSEPLSKALVELRSLDSSARVYSFTTTAD